MKKATFSVSILNILLFVTQFISRSLDEKAKSGWLRNSGGLSLSSSGKRKVSYVKH